MSLPTSLSSGLISDSARGTSRARPDLELRSAAPISRVALRSRHEHPANAPARPALRGKRDRRRRRCAEQLPAAAEAPYPREARLCVGGP